MDFGLQGGFAHCIENEQKFPHYFGKVSVHSQAFGVKTSSLLNSGVYSDPSHLPSGSDWRYDGPGAATLEEADPREF